MNLSAILYNKGFIFFDGVEYSKKYLDFLLNKSNYIENMEWPVRNILFRTSIPPELNIFCLLPSFIQDQYREQKVIWNAKMVHKGYVVRPHRDAVFVYDYLPGEVIIILWITPEPYEGREFVYGRIKDLSKIETKISDNVITQLGIYDSNLEIHGMVKPKTGMGVLIDRTNPIWWHSVEELTTDSRVISIGGFV